MSAEPVALHPTDWRELACGLAFPEGPVVLPDGSLALVEVAAGTVVHLTTEGPRAGQWSVLARPGGGPNGLALDAAGQLYLCNNGGFRWHRAASGALYPVGQAENYSGGRIETIDPATGRCARLCDSFTDPAGAVRVLCGPNDLVLDQRGGLWFTDLGKSRSRDRDHGGLYYVRTDGTALTEAAYPLITPNGIGLTPDGQHLVVAETESARLWRFAIEGPGALSRQPWPAPAHGGTLLASLGGPPLARLDSLRIDSAGRIHIGTLVHGGISHCAPDGQLLGHTPLPDPYVTNLAIDPARPNRAYATLATTGRVFMTERWPFASQLSPSLRAPR